ncbi:hypothetical protein BaRGS_00001536, partial [Batillaria attramentaria]
VDFVNSIEPPIQHRLYDLGEFIGKAFGLGRQTFTELAFAGFCAPIHANPAYRMFSPVHPSTDLFKLTPKPSETDATPRQPLPDLFPPHLPRPPPLAPGLPDNGEPIDQHDSANTSRFLQPLPFQAPLIDLTGAGSASCTCQSLTRSTKPDQGVPQTLPFVNYACQVERNAMHVFLLSSPAI